MSESLLKEGKYSLRVRPHLRPLLAGEPKPNVFINQLLEAHYKVSKDYEKSKESKAL